MKKLFSIVAVIIISATTFTSCTNPTTVLPGHSGVWTAVFLDTTVVGTLIAPYTYTATLTFAKAGTGTSAAGSSTGTFTWSYNKSSKQITITPSGGSATIYSVIEAKGKEEKWYWSETGSGYRDGSLVTLTRQ